MGFALTTSCTSNIVTEACRVGNGDGGGKCNAIFLLWYGRANVGSWQPHVHMAGCPHLSSFDIRIALQQFYT